MPPLPPFVVRPEKIGESICTRCFLTVRVSNDFPALEQAQAHHNCTNANLDAVRDQATWTRT
jgi:hypothetical protein